MSVWTLEKLMEWEAALRSGEYPMGYKSLANRIKVGGPLHYCCLGVGCEILGLKSRVIELDDDDDYDDDEYIDEYALQHVERLEYIMSVDEPTMGFLPRDANLPFGGGAPGYLTHDLDSSINLFNTTSKVVKNRQGYTVSLVDCNDSGEFTQDQLADLVHFFFVVPAQLDGPRNAYLAAVAVAERDAARRKQEALNDEFMASIDGL